MPQGDLSFPKMLSLWGAQGKLPQGDRGEEQHGSTPSALRRAHQETASAFPRSRQPWLPPPQHTVDRALPANSGGTGTQHRSPVASHCATSLLTQLFHALLSPQFLPQLLPQILILQLVT